MDWLTLALVILTITSNIKAQEGYNYPRPKTPFPGGDISPNGASGSRPELGGGIQQPSGVPSGAQGQFGGSQQPSGGYTTGGQGRLPIGTSDTFGTQQPSGGVKIGTPSGTQTLFGNQQPSTSTFGTSTGTQRPFGAQQPSVSGGYSVSGQSGTPGASSGTSGTSTGTQTPFGVQQPSTGYPSRGSTTPSGTPGTHQPSGGYTGEGQLGTSSGIQGSFGIQPSAGYPGRGQTGISGGIQRPYGIQESSAGTQSGGPGSFESQRPEVSGDRRFESQKPSTTYPGQSAFGATSVTQKPFVTQAGRFEAGRRVDSQQPVVEGPSNGVFGGQIPEIARQGGQLPSTIGRPQGQEVTGPSTGSQQGYNYPSPQKPFSGTEQIGTTGSGVSTAPRPGGIGSGFGQRPTISPTAERPFGENGFPGSTQFPSGKERPSGSLNGYTTSGLERPTGQQFPSVSSRPLGTGQQTLGGYPEAGQPQGSFASEVGGRYPSATGQSSVFPDKQGRGDFSEEGKSTDQFPVGQGDYVGQRQGYARSRKPEGSQFPSGGSTQVAEPSQRPGFAGRTTTSQSTSGGIQGEPQTVDGQRPGGFPSSGQTGFPAVGIPSRPQLPSGGSTASQDKPSSTGYQSYLPPEQPGTGGLPLADVPASQFPSSSFTSTGFRPQTEYGSISGSQRSSGATRQPVQSENGYTGPGLSAGGESNGRKPSGSETSGFPQQPTGSQNEYGDSGSTLTGSQFPSGTTRQPIQPQNGYARPGVFTGRESTDRKPSGSQTSGFPQQPIGSQNGYGTSGTSLPGSQFSSGATTGQPIQPQNGYTRPGVSTGGESNGRKPSGSESSGFPQQPTGSQNGYGASSPTLTGSQFSSGTTTGQPAQPQNGYGRPGVSTGGVSSGRKPSGSDTSGFIRQPAGSQNGFGSSDTTLPGSQFSSGLSGQPSRTQNGQNAPAGSTEGILTGGRPLGSPSTDGQTESGADQGTNGFEKPLTPQLVRPGSTGRAETGYSLDQAIKEGFPRRTGGRTLPGFQQDTRGFLPSQQEPSDEGSYEGEEDEGDYSAIPGEPGRDYPILSDVPETSFTCDDQEFRGYYADVETRCQLFHICANNITYDFICPNGTIFHQENLVCVWWNQFDCETAPSLYRINEHIYDFSISGVEQTGGILMPGQEFPEFLRGQKNLPLGRTTPGAETEGQGPQRVLGSSERPGYSRYPSQRPYSPRLLSDEDRYSGKAQEGVSQTPTVQESTGFVSEPQQGTGGYQAPTGVLQRPGNVGQRPGGYSSDGSEGSSSPTSIGYPNKATQGTGGYQVPSGESQVFGNGLQRPVGSQGIGQSQGPSRSYQRPGSDAQIPGEELQRPVESSSRGYTSGKGRNLGSNGFPTGSGVTSGPEQYVRDGISRPSDAPAGQQIGEGSRTQQAGGYSTGASPRPGFTQSSTPSESRSPFSGSTQPHTPTREYLPSV